MAVAVAGDVTALLIAGARARLVAAFRAGSAARPVVAPRSWPARSAVRTDLSVLARVGPERAMPLRSALPRPWLPSPWLPRPVLHWPVLHWPELARTTLRAEASRSAATARDHPARTGRLGSWTMMVRGTRRP